VSDVQETLQQLVERRLREMGRSRGRHEPISLLEAFEAVPEDQREVTYEVLRRVRNGHSKIGDRAVRTIATMLEVEPAVVAFAAGRRADLGPFVLPERASRLSEPERQAVLATIDLFLNAAERAPDEVIIREALSRSVVRDVVVATLDPGGSPADDPKAADVALAARRGQIEPGEDEHPA
jgi:hypothetical protein